MVNQRLLLSGSLLYFIAIFYSAWGGDGQPLPIDLYLIGIGVAFAGYFVACISVFRCESDARHSIGIRAGQFVLLLVIASRLMMVTAPARFNSDVSRYVWDGFLVCQGVNPYQYAPSDSALDAVRDQALYSDLKEEFNDIRTVYGPVAMFCFATSHQLDWLVSNPHHRIRLLVTLGDLLTIVILSMVLMRLGYSQLYCLVYAMNPLLLDALAQRGQMEGFLLPWLALGLYFLARRRWIGVGFALAMAAATKINLLILPTIVFAALIRNDRKACIPFAITFSSVFLLAHWPVFSIGLEGCSGLIRYAANWKTNGSLFSIVELLVNDSFARIIVAVAFFAIWFWRIVAIARSESDSVSISDSICKEWALLIVVLLMLSPAVFPWYLTWVLPLVAIISVNPKNRYFFWMTGLWSMTSFAWYLNFVVRDPQIECYFDDLRSNLMILSRNLTEPWRILEYSLVYGCLLVYLFNFLKNRGTVQ
ncbi:MAG: hypothetical protein AAGA30_14005 [Planctomycetota bacterium]